MEVAAKTNKDFHADAFQPGSAITYNPLQKKVNGSFYLDTRAPLGTYGQIPPNNTAAGTALNSRANVPTGLGTGVNVLTDDSGNVSI